MIIIIIITSLFALNYIMYKEWFWKAVKGVKMLENLAEFWMDLLEDKFLKDLVNKLLLNILMQS